jgi:hypothetical protein
MTACPYQIKQDATGYLIVRPILTGGHMTIAGPYNTRYEAEVAALARWNGKGGRRAA